MYVRDLLFRILRSLVALLLVKLLTLGIIQVNLILHSLTRNIVSVGRAVEGLPEKWYCWANIYIIAFVKIYSALGL